MAAHAAASSVRAQSVRSGDARCSSGMGLYTQRTGLAKTSNGQAGTLVQFPSACCPAVGQASSLPHGGTEQSARLRTAGASGGGFGTDEYLLSGRAFSRQRTTGALRLHFGTKFIGQSADQ